ncbi:MAG: bifunctional 4-hydroxy-3-methylbut-2-enyl diphosphate reductase/30S ribosomal protein S1 [Lachnospiraceae bacterium]|nr:bifunctional 4-hydroxy-3-methylbut-2-enyl diphosphate reductase/30S ribosomal protein S1 [Ruminococcus sp.]MCM1276088.1 bifunctional 4-hydroxy-3-methylbut-2-enyl diphosphate reductase/30S ribosomal protein S1 [Lachnospiraceae bacterium]
MYIEIAEKAGFCFGVERAISLAERAAEKYGGVFTLGELIHNERAVADLERKGVRAVESVSDADGKPLIIRSHGVSEAVEAEARKHASEVLDATCPFVKKIHGIVAALPENAKAVVLGDRAHPEVVGIVGRARCRAFACKDFDEIEDLFKHGIIAENDAAVLVAQTTFDRSKFLEYSRKVGERYGCVKIYDTICNATAERQKCARELAKRAALMIVVGGKSSSNTRKLADICGEYCETVFVTTAEEVPLQTLRGLRSDSIIGITAGASAPAYTIKEVHERMNEEITKINNENEEDFASLLEQDQSFNRLYTGKRVKATVVNINNKGEVVVEVGAKQTGYISRDELTNDPNAKIEDLVKPGDVIDAVVVKVDDSVGTAALSKKRVDAQLGLEKLQAVKESAETIEGTVAQVVKGGVIVIYENTRVFIPASHTGVPRGGKLDDLLKKPVKFKIIEVTNERGGRVVGSIRQANKEVRDAERAKFWESIDVGQKFEGEVRSIESYGVFVDIGPVDGLVHTADLTWNRVGHPKDIVKVGDKISVVVKSFDPEKKRVSLSAKDPDDNPWIKFVSEYRKGDVIKATVVSITEFGAFAQIIPGVDGLIHISQISTERVASIASVLSVGQEVEVKIIDIDEEKNRVSLSIKALMETEAPSEDEE